MNDIRLMKTGLEEKYDWVFNHEDLETIRGKQQLVNAVRHAVLLRPDELIQEAYQTKGCTAHNHIYAANSTSGQSQVCGEVETAAKSVNGVYNARAVVAEGDLYDARIQLTILTDDMEEVTIDEI